MSSPRNLYDEHLQVCEIDVLPGRTIQAVRWTSEAMDSLRVDFRDGSFVLIGARSVWSEAFLDLSTAAS